METKTKGDKQMSDLGKAMNEKDLSTRKSMLQSVCFRHMPQCATWTVAMNEIERLNKLGVKSLAQKHIEQCHK